MAKAPDSKLSRRYIHSTSKFEYKTGPLAGESFDPNSADFKALMTSINGEKAIALRGKFADHNEKIKNEQSGQTIPIVLIPKHDLKIYRHVKKYDPQTGYLDHDNEFDIGELAKAARDAKAAKDAAKLIDQGVDALNSVFETNIDLDAEGLFNSQQKEDTEESAINYIEITAKDGMHDFLGIKFEYTYEKEITTFTLSFNNERGKNRNRFMSGDVVEFYFDLVPEEIIVKLEKDNFAVKKDDIKMSLPLVFTGVLEEFSANESADGLTIDWSGRNGAYILAEVSINNHYPTATETLCTSYNTMSYEEIIWNMIVYNTGMVVGEIDLGNKRQYFYLGSEGADATATDREGQTAGTGDDVTAETMDIMDVDGLDKKQTQIGGVPVGESNFSKFKKLLIQIMSKHEYCTLNNDGKTQIRWSSLLDFDLLKPKIFSMAEVEMFAGTQATTAADAQVEFAQGLLGSYKYGPAEDSGIAPNIRFKAKFARDIFSLQYQIMKKNYERILLAAPIKTQVLTKDGERVKSILITRTMYFESIKNPIVTSTSNRSEAKLGDTGINDQLLPILEAIYKDLQLEVQSQATGLLIEEDTSWYKRVLALYGQSAGTEESSNFVITNASFGEGNKKGSDTVNAYGGLQFNRDASKMPLVMQDPKEPPSIGAVLKVPYPKLDKYSIVFCNFFPMTLAKDAKGLADTFENGALDPILTVSSVYPILTKDFTITIMITAQKVDEPANKGQVGALAGLLQRQNMYVDLKVFINSPGAAPGKTSTKIVVDQQSVPNNLSIIASILDNSGYLTATMTTAGRSAPSQPIGIPSFDNQSAKAIGARTDGSIDLMPGSQTERPKVGDNATNIKFIAKGKVLDCVKKAIEKFFSCILYVDEFNIAHVRPRYKMLQFEKDPNSPPVWGLYGGHPVYPRLFKATWKDKLQITPNAVVVMGESAHKDNSVIIAKASHGLLQGRFGERQVLEDKSNESFNNKFEAYNSAKNKLLSYIRNGYEATVECDIIPRLRPGHRIDIADFVTGMIGGFLIENIQWTYAKHQGMKMILNLSSQMLATEDAFTSTAIASETGFDKGFLARNFANSEKQTGFFETLFRDSSIEALKASTSEDLKSEDEELERQREIYKNRDPLVFDIEEPGRIKFDRRKGFDIAPPAPESIKPTKEDIPGGKTDGGGGGAGFDGGKTDGGGGGAGFDGGKTDGGGGGTGF